ncbi:AMP-binding enzyme family protein [Collimonas arenae]|uniref:Long-chain-fatty-acid--CoA ligase n=1 Tax=Collimonas arenae TaxID=279058 RepID=A0A127QNS8_9BURK|nr:long-chain fatty acid--CoA ligase [Collimonas arenae]AMP01851.1 AMP-binding enzyme family protein [Collimonas arenae]AMP11750.1 AMP-binding enzyme family protein [Collimonas arenae]
MDKFWLKSYPEGVSTEIDYTQYQSLVQLLEEAFQKYAARNAYACMGKYLTYAEVDQLSRKVGAWLQAKGLQKGARVAIMMPNVLQYPVAIAAILRAGYTVVNVNPLYTPRELEHQLNDSGAEAIFILENFATTLQQVVARTKIKHVVVASMGDLMGVKGLLVNLVVRHVKKMVPSFSLPGSVPFNTVLSQASSMQLKPVALTPDDVAFLQYTGGTTGVSKGATLSHRNVVANVLQAEAWLSPGLAKGPKVEQLAFVCALPLYHIFALTVCGMLGMREGALNLLIPNPRDIAGLIKEMSKYQINTFPAVNTLYNALLHHPDFAKLDFSGYRVCVGGGMAVQKAVADKWMEVTGCPIIEGYGLSETSPIACANPCTITEYSGTIGLPLPSTEIAILDDAGNPVPLGQPGEIAIRGPQVMSGYWNRPDETAKVMTPDGFFKSGDIGVMDERGYTKIVDRKKDMILVSGFNVYPNEVEGVVVQHPGVLECACVGVPDEHAGEVVKIFVVRKDPALTAEQLMAYCREQLTGYKRPKYIEFRTELPKTNVGKILRRELRDEKPVEQKQAA